MVIGGLGKRGGLPCEALDQFCLQSACKVHPRTQDSLARPAVHAKFPLGSGTLHMQPCLLDCLNFLSNDLLEFPMTHNNIKSVCGRQILSLTIILEAEKTHLWYQSRTVLPLSTLIVWWGGGGGPTWMGSQP